MDQLDRYLASSFPEYYYSAPEGCSLLFIGESGSFEPLLCLFTVACPKNHFKPTEVKATIERIKELGISKVGRRLSELLGITYLIVVFPDKTTDIDSVHLWVKVGDSVIKKYNSLQTIELLSKLSGKNLRRDKTKPKEINKTSTDLFHDWSRTNLRSGKDGIIKVNLDGFYEDDTKRIIIEIKRSSTPPLSKWKPYRSDYSGLSFLNTIARKTLSNFWIMHHETAALLKEIEPDDSLSIFVVDTDEHDTISYNKIINPIELDEVKSLFRKKA